MLMCKSRKSCVTTEFGSTLHLHGKHCWYEPLTLEERADVWDDMIKDLQTKGSVCFSFRKSTSDCSVGEANSKLPLRLAERPIIPKLIMTKLFYVGFFSSRYDASVPCSDAHRGPGHIRHPNVFRLPTL